MAPPTLARAPRLVPIGTAQFPTPARRPPNSRLDCGKARRVLEVRLAGWIEQLDQAWAQYGAGSA